MRPLLYLRREFAGTARAVGGPQVSIDDEGSTIRVGKGPLIKRPFVLVNR